MTPDSLSAATTGSSQRYNDRKTNLIELYRRPLRRAGPKPQTDTQGKHVRLRGKGVGPPEAKEWAYHPAKHFVPGKSFVSSVFPLIQQKYPSTPPALLRTSVRLSDRAYEAHLAGGAASVVSPPPAHRPLRRPGTAGPGTARVLCIVPPGVDDPPVPTYALLGTARRDVFVTSRPTTAPACVLLTKKQTRVGYDKARGAYEDVFRYRHSAGICPRDYKWTHGNFGALKVSRFPRGLVQMTAERTTAPQLTTPSTNQARSNFFDTRNSYQFNRMRGQMSEVLVS